MAYGTLSTLDTLAASQSTITQLGEDKAWEAIRVALEAHNRQVNEMQSNLVEVTTDKQRRYGTIDAMVMDEIDEFGTPDAQKIAAGTTVGFPMRLYGAALQWTRKYLANATGVELAAQVNALMDADQKLVMRQIKRAIFGPSNYTFVDRLTDGVSLSVKALVNADSAALPPGPNGEEFDGSTHTHYKYTASTAIAAADLTGLIETVVEHYSSGQPIVYINRAQETAVRNLTGFTAYLDARIVPGSGTTTARGNLDPSNLYNRAIGIFGSAEVWVKPWIPSGYLFCFIQGGPAPIVMRTRRAGSGNLELAYEDEAYPLRARGYEREAGWAIWNRTNGAVLFVDAGSAGAYVAPTIT